MAIEVKKREGESIGSLLYRFTKKMQQSGVLREAKRRRFHNRPTSRIKRKSSALHRAGKQKEMERARKLGIVSLR